MWRRKANILVVMLFVCSKAHCQLLTLNNDTYYSVYDLGLQCPHQVWWVLKPSDIGRVKRNPSWQFVNDIYHPLAQGTTTDYVHSGYHRGHMCPAKDRSNSLSRMQSTFTMSNIAPQTPSVNTGSWKATEDWCRRTVMQFDSICILVQPVFMNRDTVYIGKHHLAVPHAFMKVAYLPQNDSVLNCWFIFNH